MNHITIVLLCAFYLLHATLPVEGFLGVVWGRLATQRMIPSMVVDVLLQNNITDVKILSASDNVLAAFAGTNINLAITMPNKQMEYVNSSLIVDMWVQKNIIHFLQMNLTFSYIYIGTEPLSKTFFGRSYDECVPLIDMMQRCLDRRNLTGIKVTTSNYIDILVAPISKPSLAEFRPDLKELLFNYCSVIKRSTAPFGIGFHPLITVQENFNNDVEFAFFENNSTSKFKDGKFTYSNIFEVVYDSTVYALEKLGFHDLPITITSIGWPTDGIEGGSLGNAERFLQGLAKFLRSQKGTPRRPGINIDTYIHNLVDENAMKTSVSRPFQRHFGIYEFDGQPKFNLDFQGKEQKVLPVSAVGITSMPKRWCILDVSKVSLDQIPFETLDQHYNISCQKGDCTPMSPGGSCSTLPFPLNYSYGFNIGFQANKQNLTGKSSCDYGGYGVVVPDDPSTLTCSFPVEIIAAETTNFLGQGISPALASPPNSLSIILLILQIIVIIVILHQ